VKGRACQGCGPDSTLFRQVPIPDLLGRLYLHSMPGRHEALSESLEEIDRLGITQVISLVPMYEIKLKSPDFAALLEQGPGWLSTVFPVPDFGVPDDAAAFRALAREAAEILRSGESMLVHCGAGIGRTGTLAICILRELGYEVKEAMDAVLRAGSGPETPDQQAICRGPLSGSG
jgi:protein-tyrosine phosphatase